MALSGVVLLIVAPVFWAQFDIGQSERLSKGWETLRESLAPAEYFMASASLRYGEPVTDEQRKLVEKYDPLIKESKRVAAEIFTYDRYSRAVTGAAVFLGLLGLALTWFGFRLWYLRVQRQLDRILLKEAKTHESST